MQASIKNFFRLFLLTFGFGMWPVGPVAAQTYTILHNFTAGSSSNSDGASPIAELMLSGNTLFGAANAGGAYGNGTVFAVSTDGTSFTTLHVFSATSGT